MFEAVGIWTWALLFSVIGIVLGSLISIGGLVRQILGLLVVSASFASFVTIIAYRGYQFPGTDQPIGLLAGALAFVILGLGMISRGLSNEQAERSLKVGIPKVNMGTVVAVGVASVFVAVGGLFVYNALDIKANNADQGFNVFQSMFERQNNSNLHRFERFLAK